MILNDFHCHFFSSSFFQALGRQAGLQEGEDLARIVTGRLEWDNPGSNLELAGRWIQELDREGVNRIGLIASLPGEETSVAEAVEAFPERFVGQFMIDPGQPDALDRTRHAFAELGLSVVCLFPAMHLFRLDSDESMGILEIANELNRVAFVHCGVLSLGVRKKLGLPSPFDVRFGNPLDLQRATHSFPRLPIVIPHFGAGFFREVLVLADLHPGIHLDTSSSNSWVKYSPDLNLQTVFSTAFEVVGSDRLLFGTDSSFFPRGWQSSILGTQQEILSDLGIAKQEQEALFGANFDRLFPAG